MEYWKSIEYQFFDKLGKHFLVFPLRQRVQTCKWSARPDAESVSNMVAKLVCGYPPSNRIGNKAAAEVEDDPRRRSLIRTITVTKI